MTSDIANLGVLGCPGADRLSLIQALNSGQFDENHPTRLMHHKNSLVAIDELIAPLIGVLWENGIETCHSCQGSPSSPGYISFPSFADLTTFLRPLDYLGDLIRLDFIDSVDWSIVDLPPGAKDLESFTSPGIYSARIDWELLGSVKEVFGV